MADKTKENMKHLKEIYKLWERQAEENSKRSKSEKKSESFKLAGLPTVVEAPEHTGKAC